MDKTAKPSSRLLSRKVLFFAMVPTIISLHFGFSIFSNMLKNVNEHEESDLPFYKYCETKFDINEAASKIAKAQNP
ncbi:uncharacterized protein LOC111679074 isoform X1 [Lucilia cuprina]|uniref:uncharacterized protein LOC111679074 isoform X1 n=1 Tax=Lucilia cuprina TaxID=7375 RepID=UPI001F058963|nr:uncharacterized protein LOC111679074 isoform X1 [Lucilia cuprina]